MCVSRTSENGTANITNTLRPHILKVYLEILLADRRLESNALGENGTVNITDTLRPHILKVCLEILLTVPTLGSDALC